MSMAKMAAGVAKTLGTFLGLLSLVSLVVGGIVIANIMFVSVGERTQGDRHPPRLRGDRARHPAASSWARRCSSRPPAAWPGPCSASSLSFGFARMKNMPTVISWEPFVLALVFSSLVGVLAGLQPARRAAALDPVEAIRG